MTDEDKRCQVQVSGIPDNMTSEEIMLFFESERYCPNGGEVKSIRNVQPNMVVVTFCDSSVVDHLGRCVTMPPDIKLYLEPYKSPESQVVVLDDQVKTTSDRTNLSRNSSNSSICSSSSSHSGDGSNTNMKSTNSLNDCPEMLNHSTSSSSSSEDKTGIDVVIASESVSWNKSSQDIHKKPFSDYTSRTFSGNRTDSNRRNQFAGKRSSSFSAKRSNTVFHGSESTSSDKMDRRKSEAMTKGLVMMKGGSKTLVYGHENSRLGPSKQLLTAWKDCDTMTVHKYDSDHEVDPLDPMDPLDPADALFPSSDEDDSAADMETKNLSFSIDQLKLLQLDFQLNDRRYGCSVTFDERNCTVTMNGRSDDLITTELHLRGIVLQSTSNQLDIPKSSQKLLLSKRGGEWLVKEFSQRDLLAVFHVKDGKAHIVALDDTTLQSACDLLDKILTSQKLPFDDSIKSYLQSATWARRVDEIELSGLVSIDTDYSQQFILITGCAADVSKCTLEIRKTVNMNSSKTHPMKHKVGVVRLLKSQRHEMNSKVNASAGTSVQLEFDVQQALIKVIGVPDDVEKAAQFIETNYFKVVCYDKYEVNIQGLTLEMFKSNNSLGSEMIDLLELRKKCVIEVRGTPTRAAEPHRASRTMESVAAKPAKQKSHRIQLLQGSIVEFKADVLVNSVANRNLERAGIVTNCFLRAGGAQLQQELRRSVPQDFGNDVVITSASGKLDAKLIFHAAISRYRNQESLDRLYNLIKKCLEMADKQRGVRSIAFPTLGCGKLGYKPDDVAECFSRAVKKTGSDLQISIISFEDHLLRDFKSSLSHDSTATSSHDNESTGDSWLGRNMKKFVEGLSRPRNMPVNNKIVFHINAMSDDVIRDVRENLAKRINEMVTEAPIKDEAIASLSEETAAKIEALTSSAIDIRIDRKKSTITVKGVKSLVDETKMKVLQLVYKEGSTQERHRGSTSQSSIRYPKHWSFYKSGQQTAGKMFHKRTEITPGGGGIFEEVSRLVMNTWEQQKVGHGSDAAGLGPHTIKIRRIYCIENPSMYRTYIARRDEFRLEASVNKYHRVNGLQGEREIMTLKLGLKQLDASLVSDVNECYLLHGTKRDIVDSIERTGLDSRLSGQTVLFGPGAYFTESSTKADQYADTKTKRTPNGQPLFMYVCRVLLGHTFICQTPKPFKRPPCMQTGCYSDICASSHPFVGTFDSVIGTHKTPTVRLLFREFVIYHPDQSYPEFLVEYERQ